MINNKSQKGGTNDKRGSYLYQSFELPLCGLSKQCLVQTVIECTILFHSSPAYQWCQLADRSTAVNLLRCLKLELTAITILVFLPLSKQLVLHGFTNSSFHSSQPASWALTPRCFFFRCVTHASCTIVIHIPIDHTECYILQMPSCGVLILFHVFTIATLDII